MHYPRRFVTSLNAYTGPAKCYEAMSNGEKGLFRGILHGRNYTAAQEFEAQCKKPRRLRRITIREYGDQSANFGLADWDRGLLLFLQREARIPQSPRELRAILCHAENCRTMLATMESMRSFLNLYSLQRERTSLGEGLRLSVNRILQKLPWRYQNQVCQFYSRERPLSTSLQTGSPGLNAEPPVVGAAHLAQDVRAHGSTAASPAHRYDAFISYRHQEPDRSFARDLVWKLEADGYKIAFDERDFQASASFLEEMERCIKESRLTLAVVSPQYIGSGNCTEEAIICKVLDMSQRRRRLVPLVRERVEMPVWMYDIVGISFIDPNPFVPPFEKLKATLGTPLGNNRVG